MSRHTCTACARERVSSSTLGSGHPLTAPYQAFRTSDGWITVGASNQANYVRLTQVLEAPELAQDARFRDNAARMQNLPALVELLTQRFERRSSAEWISALGAAGVPAGPVLAIAEMLGHPQVIVREMLVETQHPKAGATKAIGCPVKLSATPASVRRPAPLYGEHTREVLLEFGFTGEEVQDLIGSGTAIQHAGDSVR